jgi:hypothetical protein
MVEALVVGLIVTLAGVCCVWQITPVSWRLQLAGSLKRRCSEQPDNRWAPVAARMAAAPAGNCSSCSARGQCPLGKGR